MNQVIKESDFLLYWGEDGKTHAQVILGDETVWISQSALAGVFGIDRTGIGRHINNVLQEGELDEKSNVQFLHVANSDKPVGFYSLDMIIAVGYRINSYKATRFRQWATRILKEYLVKGFVLDDERLKQGNRLFGKDYFRELLERIREIRTSERMFYEKITDLYATSVDYDKNDPVTHRFFAKVQNKLEFAIVGKPRLK
ncbi:MAG: RhuM family protein [Bacteroidota bacterium]